MALFGSTMIDEWSGLSRVLGFALSQLGQARRDFSGSFDFRLHLAAKLLNTATCLRLRHGVDSRAGTRTARLRIRRGLGVLFPPVQLTKSHRRELGALGFSLVFDSHARTGQARI